MKNFQFRVILSVISLFSILMMATTNFAAPVRLNQVVEIVNAKPGRANTGSFSQLRLVNGYLVFEDDNDGDDTDDTVKPAQQDDRVIRETKTEIVEDETCDCEIPVKKRAPYWLLAFAAIPLLFLIPHDKDKTPTPTRTTTPSETPMTPTPTQTPTMTPTPPKTPPPSITPTPPEPVPEPMTLLLFGTGLAGIGVAARKRFGKKRDGETVE